MKGLLIKDLLLMKNQKRFFILVFGIAVVMGFSIEPTFMIGYMTMLTSFFSVSTISYDEYNNGNAFLFTLPITRKEYVLEKYCFGGLLGFAAMALSLLVLLIMGLIQGMEIVVAGLIMIPICLLLLLASISVMMPLQLKFGAEKSRIILIAVAGGLFALGLIGGKILEGLGMDLNQVFLRMENYLIFIIFGIAILIVLGVLLSFKMSLSIINKKDF